MYQPTNELKKSSSNDDKLKPSHLPPQKHLSSGSIDTNASGIADSTISFAGSLHLGRFPAPPLSIPSTPVQSEYSPSVAGSGRTYETTAPLAPLRKKSHGSLSSPTSSKQHRPLPSLKSAGSSKSRAEPIKSQPSTPKSRTISPYDWHEGASSIDVEVDAAENRLLPTNFITSLLQENSKPRRSSIQSDAYSGFSEMTYPPVMRYPGASERPPALPPYTPLPAYKSNPKVHASRPPPSAFSPILEGSGQTSDDSDTLASNNDFTSTVIRSASRSYNIQGAPVVGVAPATLHRYSTSSSPSDLRASLTPSDDRTLSYQLATVPSTQHNSALPSSIVQPHFLRENPRANIDMHSRQSVHSTRSFVPSVISRISETGRSIARVLPWKRKPLPPVPTIPHIPIAAEAQSRLEESRYPLPHLVARADVLNGMLEKGYHPHHSLDSSYYGALPKDDAQTSALEGSSSSVRDHESTAQRRLRGDVSDPLWAEDPRSPPKVKAPRANRKRYLIILAIFVVVAAAAVGAGVGVSFSHKKSSSSLPTCSNSSTTGTFCDLDATCVCTVSGSGCDGLAQSIVTLTSTMNELFDTNYTTNSVYTAIWLANGLTTGSNCATQAILIDTPGLSSASTPNRTSWARSALLWNLVQSQNVTATASLKSFTSSAPWSTLSSDGPVSGESSSFSITVSGFEFDFAAQTISQPTVSFENIGEPSTEQISRVGTTPMAALNRMYSYGLASSTQRTNALELYWTNVLGQTASSLGTFRSAVASSTILIPFDATYDMDSQALANQITNSTSQAFPVPLSCYPGLNSSILMEIDAIEETVYGLDAVSAASSFDTSCYSDRPLYGVLDVLKLRLPFIDSRTGVATQAASLQVDVKPRAVIRSGEVLSALPLWSNSSVFTATTSNPRNYGTLNNMDHVLLDYLSSISNISVAIAVVAFITNSSPLPPSNTSALAMSLSTIPSLEVAIFGSVLPADVSNVVSSFVSPSGSLFFGSTQGQDMRNWAILGTGTSVVWAQSALATQVARDTSLTAVTFEDIWSNASLAIENNVSSVTVTNITNSLESTGLFSS